MRPAAVVPRMATLCTALLGALISACTLPESDPLDDPTRYPAVRPQPAPAQRVAQLGYEPQATFTVCTPPTCPTVTRKTLAVLRPTDERPSRTSAALRSEAREPAPEPPTQTVTASVDAPTPSPRLPPLPPTPPSPANSDPTPAAVQVALSPPASVTVPSSSPTRVGSPAATLRKLTLQFDSNSADLTDTHRRQLQGALGELRRSERLIISGRTDDQGSERLNQALAVSRALAIRRELLSLAPDLPARIEIDARGRCCYIAPNKDEDGRARNRRVELVYTPAAPSP